MARTPNSFLDVTIIVETYNLGEGGAFDRLRRALDYVENLRQRRAGVAMILADASDVGGPGDMALARLLLNYPRLRSIRVPGAGYEGIKNAAAQAAGTRFLLFLDSDCLPQDDAWLDRMLAPLHAGTAGAVTGTTLYEGASIWSRALSVMDFGYLIEASPGPIGCYASNNVAFERAAWLATPPPEGPIRCSCFAHTGQLERAGSPVVHIEGATVLHELPTFFAERWRRGYDLVAVCWLDPYLREARWLRYSVLAAPLFYGQNVAMDWRRLKVARQKFGWKTGAWLLAASLPPLVRLVDLPGVFRALAFGPSKRWTAYGAAAKPDPAGTT